MREKCRILWALPVLLSCLIPPDALANDSARAALRESIRSRTVESEGLFDEEGGGVCAEHAKKVGRLIASAGKKALGPEPDVADVAYGDHERQRFDVYLPKQISVTPAPIIFMVHGGGWCVGDKRLKSVVSEKVSRWTPKGLVVISSNYPMLAEGYDALAQAREIARAIAYAQRHAAEWGGDPSRIILMGHSAGAHLVSLVGADAGMRAAAGVKDILGVVSIDAGAIDVAMQMPKTGPKLKARYVEAFGNDPAAWPAVSPRHRVTSKSLPWLGICSLTRHDKPCEQGDAYVQKSIGLGVTAKTLPVPKSHGRLNTELGIAGSYTDSVEKFMAALDAEVAKRLK